MMHFRINNIVPDYFSHILLAIIPVLIMNVPACRESGTVEKELKPTATLEQLQTVYAKTINRAALYKEFMAQAEKEKSRSIAYLYRALARSEEVHAHLHSALMQKHGLHPQQATKEKITVGTLMQTLKMALSMEEYEANSLYATLITLAECEKCEEAVKQFKMTQDADRKHGELLRYALFKGKAMPSLQYCVCPGCGYVLTTEQVNQCPCCNGKIDLFEKI